MNCTPEQLAARIVAAVSRELHIADVPHDQRLITTSVFGVPADAMPADRRTLYDQTTGKPTMTYAYLKHPETGMQAVTFFQASEVTE